jgi:hypothetical protein
VLLFSVCDEVCELTCYELFERSGLRWSCVARLFFCGGLIEFLNINSLIICVAVVESKLLFQGLFGFLTVEIMLCIVSWSKTESK